MKGFTCTGASWDAARELAHLTLFQVLVGGGGEAVASAWGLQPISCEL